MVSSCTLHKRLHYRWNRYPCIGIYTQFRWHRYWFVQWYTDYFHPHWGTWWLHLHQIRTRRGGRRVGRPSENILIENCHFAYGHGGVAMGSEISGGIRNVTIRSCLMDNENWSPLRFKSQPSRGGTVENITLKILPSKERAVSLISIWNGVWFLRFHLHIIRWPVCAISISRI